MALPAPRESRVIPAPPGLLAPRDLKAFPGLPAPLGLPALPELLA